MKHDKNSSRRENIYKLISNEIKSEVINDNDTSLIEKIENEGYNNLDEEVIIQISVYPEKSKYLKYTINKDFFEKSVEEMAVITSSISGQAEIDYLNGEETGIYTDSNGDTYYYDVSSLDTFGINKIEKYDKTDEEVVDETNKNRNS